MNIPAILTGKNVVAAFNTGGGVAPVSTLGRLKIDNRASQDFIAPSNMGGGVDRPDGIRELNGYFVAYGDAPPVTTLTGTNSGTGTGGTRPLFVNDLCDLIYTIDGLTGVQVVGSGNTGVRLRALEVFVEPYTKEKTNLVYYNLSFGGAGNDFSLASSAPTDTSSPIELSTKSLGMQFAWWNIATVLTPPATHQLIWSPLCYFAGMRLKIVAYADMDYSSCLNGIGYYPAGNIDFTLELGERLNRWPIPVSPNAGAPYMIPGQPTTSPFSGPGTRNAGGDLVYPDLDSVVGCRMITRVNSDLSPNSYWELLYCMLDSKGGEFDRRTREFMTVNFLFERCSAPQSQVSDTGWALGHIAYVTGVQPGSSYPSTGTMYTLWGA